MGLSCLLGHDFGHPTHERERERRGEEVILTTRDVKTCRRCGTEQVLTKNTAVMNHSALASIEADTADAEATAESNGDRPPATGSASTKATRGHTSANEGKTATQTARPGGTDISVHEPSNARRAANAATITAGNTASEGANEVPAITDDAVILTDDDDPEERQPMEWPDFGVNDSGTGTSALGNVSDGSANRTDESDALDEFSIEDDATVLRCESCAVTWNPRTSSLLSGDPCPRCRSAYLTRKAK